MSHHPVARIGLLLRRLQTVETRKKFQKIVHILQAMGAPFPERFDFHHYGPYSAELRREIDAFESESLIDEQKKEGQYTTYTLKPTERLLALISADAGLEDEPWVDWAEQLNSKSPRELEGISTLLYFHQHLWPEETWRSKFAQLKPQLLSEYDSSYTEAIRLLQQANRHAA